MPYQIFAKCPGCQKEAKSVYEIEELFGFRFLENISVVRNQNGWINPSKMKKIGLKSIPQSNSNDVDMQEEEEEFKEATEDVLNDNAGIM